MLFGILVNAQDLPKVASGSLKRIENFQSKFVDARHVDVWLPAGYNPKQKYSVVYMHDGQMLFDSTTTWNKKEWGVDETFGILIKENIIRPCIVVGVWNVPEKRFADYFPQKIIDKIPENTRTTILEKQIKGKPNADNYLKFLVEELKPFIDKTYSTKKDAKNTFVMGSSMGGLISVYALCEYPQIFGGAACLSIHSPLTAYELINDKTDEEVASKFREYLSQNLPKANTKKIYFDYGNLTGDAFYKPYQTKIDAIMTSKGFDTKHWQTREFLGTNHSESAWKARLDVPILFLFKIK